MSIQSYTGYLCEYGDAQTIVCGQDAVIELSKRELDADGFNGYSTYACDEHAEMMTAHRLDYEVSILPLVREPYAPFDALMGGFTPEAINFCEQLPTCAADGQPIVDPEHAYEAPDGQLYHNRDHADEDAMITNALYILGGKNA